MTNTEKHGYEPAKTRDFREYTGELADLLDALAAAVKGGNGALA